MIYMDHAATTPVRQEVLQAMLPYFCEHFANASSSYQAARESRRAVETARAQVAHLIGAQPEEIYFTSGGSESDNWALVGAMRCADDRRQLVTTPIEHHAVLRTCEALEREGFGIRYAPVSCDGVVDSAQITGLLDERTALVSVMLANNEVGSIQPVAQIARAARGLGVLVHTDAVQAAGHIPVDVHTLGVDLLSLSAHKFGGPKGIGALYIRKGTRLDRLIRGGEQEKGMRAGTENTAAIVGMGKAAQLAEEGMEQAAARTAALRDYMVAQVDAHLPSARVNARCVPRLPGHVHLTINGADSSLLLMQMDMRGIAASAGSACASGAIERSHVLRAMGACADNEADLRFTLSEENHFEEIDRVIEALSDILR